VIFPAIYIEYINKGTFGACFNFKEIFAMIGRNAGAFFTAWGIYLGTSIGVGIVAGIVGTLIGWIPCIGQLVVLVISLASTVYVLLVFAHLFGQFGAMDAAIQPAPAA
jgi:hypothetical protein